MPANGSSVLSAGSKPHLREGLRVSTRAIRMMKVDDVDSRLSQRRCLYNIRPDLAAKDVALLCLRMHPLGGHIIRRLLGFLPDEMSIPGTTLPSLPHLPILSDLDVSNGGQDSHSISQGPLHMVMCASLLSYHDQSKRGKQEQTSNSTDPDHER